VDIPRTRPHVPRVQGQGDGAPKCTHAPAPASKHTRKQDDSTTDWSRRDQLTPPPHRTGVGLGGPQPTLPHPAPACSGGRCHTTHTHAQRACWQNKATPSGLHTLTSPPHAHRCAQCPASKRLIYSAQWVVLMGPWWPDPPQHLPHQPHARRAQLSAATPPADGVHTQLVPHLPQQCQLAGVTSHVTSHAPGR
jgi:hypothetical protein